MHSYHKLTAMWNFPTFSHQGSVNLVVLNIFPSSIFVTSPEEVNGVKKTCLQAVASICFSVNDVKDVFLDFFALER